jgi:hypothetical protein
MKLADDGQTKILPRGINFPHAGGPPTNGSALPLSTPEIPVNPSPGTIQQNIAQLGGPRVSMPKSLNRNLLQLHIGRR